MTNNSTTKTRCPLPVVKDSLTPQTDTPRTDACPNCGDAAADLMRTQIEMQLEIDRAEAEVAELQQQNRNCIEIIDDDAKEKAELQAEVDRLSKITQQCLNVIRAYNPTYYYDAMERFNQTNK
jgi:chromosome segregation ATPase